MVKELHNEQDKSDFKNMNTGEQILWRSGQYSVPTNLTKQQAFKKLLETISEIENISNKPTRKLSSWYYPLSAAAAVLVIVVSLWFFLFNKPIENLVAAKGQQTEVKLPDGSIVSMNADSKISYNKNKFDNKRYVKLEGEAFFNVQKGTTFSITTNQAEIKVLGTSFNVFARDNSFRISCFTGKVLVRSGNQSVTISSGESAQLQNKTLLAQREKNINETALWRVGEFKYVNTSLNLIFEEIERQFNVTFVLPEIDEKKFTGSFSNKNLVSALDIVCIPMGLSYEIGSNSKIFIKTKSH